MATLNLAPFEEKALASLWKSGPRTLSQLRLSVADAASLAAKGLVEEVPAEGKRKPKLQLTEAGRAAAGDIPPARLSARDVFVLVLRTRDEVLGEIRKLREQLSELETVDAEGGEGCEGEDGEADDGRTDSTSPERANEVTALVQAIRSLDRDQGHGGLVPLPELRRTLERTGITRANQDAVLLQAEREYLIDLKVANDPRHVDEPEAGLHVEGRGLLYWVVAR